MLQAGAARIHQLLFQNRNEGWHRGSLACKSAGCHVHARIHIESLMSRTTERYHPTLITLHWLTLLLMVGVYALIELHDGLPKGSAERALAKSWHESLGILVFAVVVLVRLPLRWMLGQPSELAGTPAWQSRLAHVMHWALYGLLIAAPSAMDRGSFDRRPGRRSRCFHASSSRERRARQGCASRARDGPRTDA